MKCILMSCMNLDSEFAENEISKIIKPDMKVVCIPFASDLQWLLNGDMTEYRERHYKPFAKYGIKDYNFYIAKVQDNYKWLKRKIDRADIVYFSGGYMENIMYHLENKYMVRFLRLLKDEKIFIGESAGTLVLEDNYLEVPYIEEHYKDYKKKPGIGILNRLEVIVHFNPHNELHHKNWETAKMMSAKKDVICLTDSGIAIVDNNKVKILGECYK